VDIAGDAVTFASTDAGTSVAIKDPITFSMRNPSTITGHVNLAGAASSNVKVYVTKVDGETMADDANPVEDAAYGLGASDEVVGVDSSGNYSTTVDSGDYYAVSAAGSNSGRVWAGGVTGRWPTVGQLKTGLVDADGSSGGVRAPDITLPAVGGAGSVSLEIPAGYDVGYATLTCLGCTDSVSMKVTAAGGYPVTLGAIPAGVYLVSYAAQTPAEESDNSRDESSGVVAVRGGASTSLAPSGFVTEGPDSFGTSSVARLNSLASPVPPTAGVPISAQTTLYSTEPNGGNAAIPGQTYRYWWADVSSVLSNASSYTPAGVEVGHVLWLISSSASATSDVMFHVVNLGTVQVGSAPNVQLTLAASTSKGRVYRVAGVPAGFTAAVTKWYRSGKAVKGNGNAYKVAKKDVGKSLKAKVTLSGTGFTSSSVVTASVKMGKLSPVVSVKKLSKRRAEVKVKVNSITKPTGVVKVKWGSKGWKTYTLKASANGVLKIKAKAGFKKGAVKAVYTPKAKSITKYVTKKTSKAVTIKY
jgi:hypothetical protein